MRDLSVRRAAAGAVAALVTLLLVGLAGTAGAQEAPRDRLVGVVNVNTATAEELQLLPGVGPARAAAILEHRTRHRGFARVEDLVSVSGIGERALERMRPHVAVEGDTTARLLAE